MNKVSMRNYQVACHDAVFKAWGFAPWAYEDMTETHSALIAEFGRSPFTANDADPVQRTLIDKATGLGKTLTAAFIIQTAVESLALRCLFLADTNELCSQPLKAINRATGIIPALEKAEDRASLNAEVVVGSVQTLQKRKRLERFPRDHFDIIIADEVHRGIAAREMIWEYFGDAKVMGMSATPFRQDQADLSKYFGSVAFSMGTFDAINQGYLTPLQVMPLRVSIDLSNAKVGMTKEGKDITDESAGSTIEPYHREIVRQLKEVTADRRAVLIFHPLVRTSQAFTRICLEEGLSAMHCDGNTPDRPHILEQFERGDFKVLNNAQTFTTGVDFLRADTILNLRVTKSRGLFRQIVGRGLRVLPGVIDGLTSPQARRTAIAASLKPSTLLLDPLWQSEKLKLAGPASLIAMNEADEDAIAERVKLKRTPEELAEISREVQREREEKLRKALEEQAAQQAADATRRATLLDARTLLLDLHDRELTNYEPAMPWEAKPVADWQVKKLEQLGYDPSNVTCAGLATKLLDAVNGRESRGLAAVEAFGALRAHGVAEPASVSLNEAIRVLGTSYPCCFGSRHHGAPLKDVPKGYWSWLMQSDDIRAIKSRQSLDRRCPSALRFWRKCVNLQREPALVPVGETAELL